VLSDDARIPFAERTPCMLGWWTAVPIQFAELITMHRSWQ
jgi:hypothetical protein